MTCSCRRPLAGANGASPERATATECDVDHSQTLNFLLQPLCGRFRVLGLRGGSAMLSALCGACGFWRGRSPKLLVRPPPSEPEIGYSIGPKPTINTSRGILALLVLAIAPWLAISSVVAGPPTLLTPPSVRIVTGIQHNNVIPPPPPSTSAGASSYAGSRQNCVVTASHRRCH